MHLFLSALVWISCDLLQALVERSLRRLLGANLDINLVLKNKFIDMVDLKEPNFIIDYALSWLHITLDAQADK